MNTRSVAIAVAWLGLLIFAQAVFANKEFVRVPGTSKTNVQVLPSGGLDYSLPIVAPIGTNGVAPNISLNYSSSAGDGVLGKGWSLTGMGAVTRCAANDRLDSRLAGVNFDTNDRFCLNGTRLIVVDGDYGASGSEYRVEINSNQKVTAHGSTSSGPSYFTVHNPDGRIFHYGASDDSRVELQGQDTVHFWALSKVEDHLGNYIRFDYFEDSETGQFYPIKIHYTGNDSEGLEPYNYIEFLYEGRKDPFHSCVDGGLVQTAVKLREIVSHKYIDDPSSDGEIKPFRKYLLSYGEEDSSQFKVIPSNACGTLNTAENAEISPYQEILNSQYVANSSRIERLQRYQYLRQAMGGTHSDPGAVQFAELLGAHVSREEDRSGGLYQKLKMNLGEVSSRFEELAQEQLTEFEQLSEEEKIAYLEQKRAEIAALEAQVADDPQEHEDLQNRLDILESARERISSELKERLEAQIRESDRVMLVPMGSPYKKRMMQRFRDDLKIKFRSIVRAADECLAVATADEPPAPADQNSYCHYSDKEKAFAAFVDLGASAKVYSDLYNQLGTLLEHPDIDQIGPDAESQVQISDRNHFHHLLVAGQVVRLYKAFAQQLYQDSLQQLDNHIADVQVEMFKRNSPLELLASDDLTPAERELIEARFALSLLESEAPSLPESGELLDDFIGSYIAGLQSSLDVALLDEMQQGQDTMVAVGIVDPLTRIQNVLNSLQIIQEEAQAETLVNYQGILDGLLHGEGSILSQRSDGQGNSILGDSRLLSVLECGSDSSCFAPVVFNWTEESIGWRDTASTESVPDYLLSYDKIKAGNQGLTIDTGAISNSSDGGDEDESIELTDEQISLARELAKAGKLVDVNADGLADWVIAYRREDGSEYRGTWLNTLTGWQYSAEFTLPTLISMHGNIPLGQFIDLNNDGYLDWIGSSALPNGEVISSVQINIQNGWQSAPGMELPTSNITVLDEGYLLSGEFFVDADGSVRWFSGGGENSASQSLKLANTVWQNLTEEALPFATQTRLYGEVDGESTAVEATGIRVDFDGDGAHEWVEYVSTEGQKSYRVWQYGQDGWVENPLLSIDGVNSFEHGLFIDLDGDSKLDWVTSTQSAAGELIQRTLVQTGAGWSDDSLPLFPMIQDAEGNKVAHLHDLNKDGMVEWLQAYRSNDGTPFLQTQRLVDGAWEADSQFLLPREVAAYDGEGELIEFGEFANLSASDGIDWLNQSEIWSGAEDNADAGAALVSASGLWEADSNYALPVLESAWISKVSEILAQIEQGESVLAEDQNIVAATEDQSGSGGGAGDSSQVAMEVPVDADDSNGVKTGSLIDVDGDGRLDWVKSVRFSAAVEQKVVWLRGDDGWSRSETFVPPTPLVDFTNKSVTKIIDFDSDGLPDFLKSYNVGGDQTNEYWRNTGTQWQKTSVTMPRALYTSLDGQTFQSAVLIDLNKDGRLDLLADGSDGSSAGAWLNVGGSFVASSSYSPDFNFSVATESGRIAAGQLIDLNKDGLADWVSHQSPFDIVYLNNGSGWDLEPAYELPISLRTAGGEQQALLIDLNKDGYKDLVQSYRPLEGIEQRNTWLNTGSGWRADWQQGGDVKYHLPGTLFFEGHGMVAHLTDVNSDGYPDFVQAVEGGAALTNNRSLWLGSKAGFSMYGSGSFIPIMLQKLENNKLVTNYMLADADGDLETDLVKSSETTYAGYDVYSGLYSVAGKVDRFFNGAKRAQVSYQKGYKPFTVQVPEQRASYPLQTTTGPGVVVSGYRSFVAEGLEQANDESIISDVAYTYAGHAFDLARGQSVGFQTAESMDWVAERVSSTQFMQVFPHLGRPRLANVSQLWGNEISSTDFEYESKVNAALSDHALHSYLARTTVKNYKEDGEQLNTIVTNNTEHDPRFFIPTKEVVVLSEGGIDFTTQTVIDLEPDENHWLLGQQKSVTVTSSNTNADYAGVQSVVTTKVYNGDGMVASETTAGFKATYSYDAFGNVIEKKSGVGSGSAPRVENHGYDAKGRFQISSQNVARELTEIQFSGIPDEPTLIKVNDGSYSTYDYDGFGRKYRETFNEEVVRPFDIKFCTDVTNGDGVGACPQGAKYLTAQFSNEEKGSAAETVYYNAPGREIRRATASADSIVYLDTEYYPNGKVSSRTMPYSPGPEVEILKAEFGYDSFGRMTFSEEPGGKVRIWEYNGRAVTEYDPLGNKTTTVSTHFGAPSKIIDAHDSVTQYFYNALGQLRETRDAADNSILVKYDARGNKREVIDPDHGVTLFTHNVFGEVTSKTDALGNKQTFVYDNWGRLTNRTDEGVNASGNPVSPVTATWEYYDLNEAKQAYEDYLAELTEREVPEEDIEKLNAINYLNPNAASGMVKRIFNDDGYVSDSTYDYRSRPVENTVTLPEQGSRTLKTDYLGESSLPYTVYYPNNFSVRYEYDDFGYLEAVKNAGLNTRDHYFALVERAEFLRDDVAEALWARSVRVQNEEVRPAMDDYRRKTRTAREAEDRAIAAANKIDHFTPQVYDDSHAIEHLRSDLLRITQQSSRESRDSVISGLLWRYGPGTALPMDSSASCGGSRTYSFEVPAYNITQDVLIDPNAQPTLVQVPIVVYDHESRSNITVGYRTEERAPATREEVIESVPAKRIERHIPKVCVSASYPDIPWDKPHRLRERQLVQHIIGLMSKLRDRRNDNRATIEAEADRFENEIAIAKVEYRRANEFFTNHVQVHIDQASGLNQAGNEVHAKSYEIFVKAGRVYQFFEVEQGITFWSIEESDEINRINSERYGNGVVNTREYDQITGALATIKARHTDKDFDYQNESYFYDPAGNLRFKSHAALGTTETYDYDKLNRLTSAEYVFFSEESQREVKQKFAYDKIGNIVSKTGIGEYSYNQSQPHAVVSAGSRSYTYDDVGRMRTGDGATFEYTTFSKPSRIEDANGDYAEFAYGPTHDRYYQKRERTVDGELTTQQTYYYFKGLYEESVNGEEHVQHASIGARGKNIAVINGYNEVFTVAEEIPEFGSIDDLINDIRRGLQPTSTLLEGYFSAFNGVLDSNALVAGTSGDDLEEVPEGTRCDLVETEERYRELVNSELEISAFIEYRFSDLNEGTGDEEGDTSDDPPTEPETEERLTCLTATELIEATEVFASSLINIQYSHYDALDSVKVVTDAKGEIAGVNYYDAFGNSIIRPSDDEDEEYNSDVAFGGHEGIAGMDLVHMNGRIYDPVIGRFVSADPFVPNFTNPQALNRYSYVYNNPMKYVDPSGYKPVTATQHERNEYIYVSLAYFELEVVLPSSQDLYSLLSLSRNDPARFEQLITEWGSSPEAWDRARGFAQAGLDTSKTVRAIRQAERQSKYLKVVAVIITIFTWGADGGTIGTALGTGAYTAPILTAVSQIAITGELDVGQTILSFATVGLGDGIAGSLGLGTVPTNIIDAVATGVVRGFASHLAGGEFEHGFAAGVVEFALGKLWDENANALHNIFRGGVIAGIGAELSNEVGVDGEQLGFGGGFQRGALRVAATELIQSQLNGEFGGYCRAVADCQFSAFGDVLNLIIEGADGLSVLNTLLSGFSSVSAYRTSYDGFAEQFSNAATELRDAVASEGNFDNFTEETSGFLLAEDGVETIINEGERITAEFLQDNRSFVEASPEAYEQYVADLNQVFQSIGLELGLSDSGDSFIVRFRDFGRLSEFPDLASGAIEVFLAAEMALAIATGQQILIDEVLIATDPSSEIQIRARRVMGQVELAVVYAHQTLEELDHFLDQYEASISDPVRFEQLGGNFGMSVAIDNNGDRRWSITHDNTTFGVWVVNGDNRTEGNLLLNLTRVRALQAGGADLRSIFPNSMGVDPALNLFSFLTSLGVDYYGDTYVEIYTEDGQNYVELVGLNDSFRFDRDVLLRLADFAVPPQGELNNFLESLAISCPNDSCDLTKVLTEEQSLKWGFYIALLESMAQYELGSAGVTVVRGTFNGLRSAINSIGSPSRFVARDTISILRRGTVEWADDFARKATNRPSSNRVVLGSFDKINPSSSYDKVADSLQATYFGVSDKAWNIGMRGLTQSEQFMPNRMFLFQQHNQGKKFLFSHDPNKADPTRFLGMEVDYLRNVLNYNFRPVVIEGRQMWEAFLTSGG